MKHDIWKNVPESEVDFIEEVSGIKRERKKTKIDIACGRRCNKMCENCGFDDDTKSMFQMQTSILLLKKVSKITLVFRT